MNTILIDDRDPAVLYTSGAWQQGNWGSPEEYMSTTSLATLKGMSVTLRFNGTGVSVFGTISADKCCPAPITSYQVDGRSPTTFAPLFPQETLHRQQFFNAENLSPGVHTLVMTNMLDNDRVWLDYFEVLGHTPSQTQYPPSSLGAVRAGMEGAVFGALALFFILVCWGKRRRRNLKKVITTQSLELAVTPYDVEYSRSTDGLPPYSAQAPK